MKAIRDGKIKTAIFDMDGTIYQLDGDNGGWKNSSLQKNVKSNTAKFFSDKEGISLEDAQKIIAEISQKNIFPSIFAAERYHITRKDFFDVVWNIEPNSIVTNYEAALEVISKLSLKGLELILLTQAPSIWQKNVFSFLGLDNIFKEIHTGENYIHKTDVFSLIAKTRNPNTTLSVGDQLETDIIPAQEHGFSTFHVKSPKDLLQLFENE